MHDLSNSTGILAHQNPLGYECKYFFRLHLHLQNWSSLLQYLSDLYIISLTPTDYIR